MKGVLSARARIRRAGASLTQPTEDERVLQRSDDVLWTLAPEGVLLHNIRRHCFLELDRTGYAAWCLLDGARTVGDVVDQCVTGYRNILMPAVATRRAVSEVVDTLSKFGFIEPASGDERFD